MTVSDALRRSPYMAPPSFDEEKLSIDDAKKWTESDPDRAIECFDQILAQKNHSRLERYLILLEAAKAKLVRSNAKNRDSARECLKEALDLIPLIDFPDPSWQGAECFKYLARVCIQEKDKVGARKFFQDAWDVCKHHEPAAIEFVEFLYKNNDFGSAIEICNQGLQANPNSPEFFYSSAKIHFACRRTLDALKACDACLALKNIDKSIRLNVLDLAAESALVRKTRKVAARYLHLACEEDDSPLSRVERSHKLLEVSLGEAISNIFKSLINWDRTDQFLLESIRKNPEEALEIFDSILKSDIDRRVVLAYRAFARIVSQGSDLLNQARENLEEALKIHEDTKVQGKDGFKALVFHLHALLSIRENRFKDALKYYQDGKEIDPSVGHDIYDYMVLPEGEIDSSQAIDFLREIENFSSHFFCAQIYATMKNWEEVCNQCSKYVGRGPIKCGKRDITTDVFELSAKASLSMEKPDHKGAHAAMRTAFDADSSVRLIKMFETLVQLRKIIAPQNQDEEAQTGRDLAHMIKVGVFLLHKDQPKEALKLFDYVLRYEGKIEKTTLVKLLIAKAKAGAKANIGEDFSSFHHTLDHAFRLLADKTLNEKQILNMKAEIAQARAFVFVEEKQFAEAQMKFDEAWRIKKTADFCMSYVFFLAKQKNIERAKKILGEGNYYLNEIDNTNYRWIYGNLFFQAEKWEKALECYEPLLNSNELNFEGRMRVATMAQEAANHLKHYEIAQDYAFKACLYDSGSKKLQKFKVLLEMTKQNVIDKHLTTLEIMGKGDIRYVSLLLQTYQVELAMHPRHRMSFLLKRAKLYEMGKDREKAVADYQEVIKLIDANPVHFSPKERKFAEKAIKVG